MKPLVKPRFREAYGDNDGPGPRGWHGGKGGRGTPPAPLPSRRVNGETITRVELYTGQEGGAAENEQFIRDVIAAVDDKDYSGISCSVDRVIAGGPGYYDITTCEYTHADNNDEFEDDEGNTASVEKFLVDIQWSGKDGEHPTWRDVIDAIVDCANDDFGGLMFEGDTLQG